MYICSASWTVLSYIQLETALRDSAFATLVKHVGRRRQSNRKNQVPTVHKGYSRRNVYSGCAQGTHILCKKSKEVHLTSYYHFHHITNASTIQLANVCPGIVISIYDDVMRARAKVLGSHGKRARSSRACAWLILAVNVFGTVGHSHFQQQSAPLYRDLGGSHRS